MNDPWQFLILDPNTATERDVKAAYARLLKQHRPDQDPEGFKKLREAYEAALAFIANRNASAEPGPSYAAADVVSRSDESPAVPEGIAVPFDVASLPEAVRASLSGIEHAVTTGNDEQMQAAVDAFRDECTRANVSAERRVAALQQAFRSEARLVSRGVTKGLMVDFAEHGQVNFCHAVVTTWQESGHQKRLAEFGFAMLDRCRLLATPEGAVLMARVALLTGLEFPNLATKLADASFPHLPVDGRTQFVSQIEHQVALGKIFAQVRPEVLPFWLKMLRNSEATRDWSSDEAKRALRSLIDDNRFQWEGWGVVRQMMPDAVWATVERELQEQVKKVRQQMPGAGAKKVGWILVPIVILLLNVVRWIGEQQSSRSNVPSLPYYRSEKRGEQGAGFRWTSEAAKQQNDLMTRLQESQRQAILKQQNNLWAPAPGMRPSPLPSDILNSVQQTRPPASPGSKPADAQQPAVNLPSTTVIPQINQPQSGKVPSVIDMMTSPGTQPGGAVPNPLLQQPRR